MSGLELKIESGIARLTINRPERRNAIDLQMHSELVGMWSELAADHDVRAVVLTGAGSAFSAGGDKSGFATFSDPAVRARSSAEAHALFFSMLNFPKPIIAAVRGPAVGLGCTLALLSDVVIAGESAYFADPHLSVGLVPGDGGGVLWAPSVGHAKARYFLLTGERLSAAEAERVGLIATVVPDEAVEERSTALATSLAAIDAVSFTATKRLLNLPIAQSAAGAMEFGLAAEELSMLTLKDGESA